jgi:hypothetical protein
MHGGEKWYGGNSLVEEWRRSFRNVFICGILSRKKAVNEA